MRLIVNADDLGSSPKVNDAIFKLMASGAVRSASVLVNGRAFEDAMSRMREFPACSLGVHLNVTDGAPIGPADGLGPLLDENGRFVMDAIRAHAMRTSVRRAVFAEWARQIQRIKDAGGKVTHIDSHNEVHTNPWLFGVLKQVQKKFGISRVRIARTLPGTSGGFASRAAKSLWKSLLRLDGTRTTDFFASLSDYKERSEARTLQGSYTVELMVHPGLEKYRPETNLLSSDWWADQARTHALITYDEL